MTLLAPTSPQMQTVMAHHSFPTPDSWVLFSHPMEVDGSAAIDLQQCKLP